MAGKLENDSASALSKRRDTETGNRWVAFEGLRGRGGNECRGVVNWSFERHVQARGKSRKDVMQIERGRHRSLC